MSLIEKGKRITDLSQDKWCRREFAYKLLQLGFVVVPTLNKQVIFVQVVGNINSDYWYATDSSHHRLCIELIATAFAFTINFYN